VREIPNPETSDWKSNKAPKLKAAMKALDPQWTKCFHFNGTHEEERRKCPDLHKVGSHYENLSQKQTQKVIFSRKGKVIKRSKCSKDKTEGKLLCFM